MKITWTTLVVETLRLVDEPLSARELMKHTGASSNQASATLTFLEKRKVIEAVEQEGELFWFLTGKDERKRTKREGREHDTRHRVPGYSSKRGRTLLGKSKVSAAEKEAERELFWPYEIVRIETAFSRLKGLE